MNDLINDIKKLTDIKESVGLFSTSTIQSFIQDMINEKKKQVDDFEIQNMSYEQYEEHMKGRGFND